MERACACALVYVGLERAIMMLLFSWYPSYSMIPLTSPTPPVRPGMVRGASPNHLRTLFHRHTPPRAHTCTYPRPQCRFMCAEREDGWGWVAGDIVPVTNSERMFVIFVALLGMAHRTMKWSNRCTKASKGIGPALH